MNHKPPRTSASWWIEERTDRIMAGLWPALAFFASVIAAVILVVTDGNAVLAAAFVAVIVVVAVSVYRLDWGFFLLVFSVLLFDQHPIPGVKSITIDVSYFSNLNNFKGVDRSVILTPMEMHTILVLCVWIVTLAIRKTYGLVSIPKKGAAIAFFTVLAFGWVYGMATGGDPLVSFWEMRAMVYLCFFTWWTPQIVRTRAQLHMLVWVIIAGISAQAFQGTFRFASNGFSFGHWPNILETYTSHEDPVFMILLFFLLGGIVIYNVRDTQRKALLYLVPILVLGYIAAQRRATYASIMASGLVFFMLMPKMHKVRLSKALAVFGVLFGIYLAIFWNSYSRAGAIAQQFKATVTEEAGTRGQKDITSTLYRKSESFNLATTIRHAPVIGIGFGKAFERPLKPWGSVFPLSDFIPHNQIFWIFAKLGIVGGFCFWFMFNTYALQGTLVFYRLKDPYLKAVCAVCVIAIANQLVVSYVDMQLTFYRNMTILGVLMGTIQILDRWTSTASPEIDVH